MATTASSVTSGGILTVLSTADLMVGQTVRLTGTPFGGLLANKSYYITVVTSSTLTLSLTRGGAAIAIAGGSGTMVVTAGPRLGKGIGNLISAGSDQDYNNIQAIVSKVLGPPTNDDPQFGYNQTPLASSQVAVGNLVSLSQWANLRTDMIKARGHQTGSLSESNNITLPTTTSRITEALRLQYWNYSETINNLKNTVGVGQVTPATAVSTSLRLDDWNNNISSEVTLNFGDLATARAFFNASGQIIISCQLSGPFSTASTSKANTFAQMFSEMGAITLGRNSTFLAAGSSGTPSNIGYFQLTSTAQQIFRKAAPTGAYTPNEFIVKARISGSSVILTMEYNDLDIGQLDINGNNRGAITWTDPLSGQVVTGNVDEYIGGELRQIIALIRPSGAYVSIPAPTVSLSGNLTSSASAVFGLTASVDTVNEGGTVEVVLRTQGVADGQSFPYTVSGVTSDRFSSGFLTGSFTIFNNTASQSWTIDANLRTESQSIMTVQLNNGTANTVIKINDTSRNPVGAALFAVPGPGQPWVAPPGVRNVSALVVGGGAGGQSLAGGGGGGGAVTIENTPITPGQTYFITVGSGGGAGASGQSSNFSGIIAVGGSVGNSGSSGSNAGPHSGGNGGFTNGGGGGGASNGISSTTMQAGGGGGGGKGGSGGNAPFSSQGGQGGPGIAVTWITGQTIWISGGGGGGASNFGGGGGFGSGSGSSGNNTGGAGQAATGGGGGGGGAYPSAAGVTGTLSGASGGAGGSGLVWIKWS